jgi:hypothetical protein
MAAHYEMTADVIAHVRRQADSLMLKVRTSWERNQQ